MYDKDKVAVLDFANDAPLFGFIKSVCYFKEEVYVLRDQFGLLSITKPTFKYFAPISGSSVFLFFVFFYFQNTQSDCSISTKFKSKNATTEHSTN